jgi:hypothetical protein
MLFEGTSSVSTETNVTWLAMYNSYHPEFLEYAELECKLES